MTPSIFRAPLRLSSKLICALGLFLAAASLHATTTTLTVTAGGATTTSVVFGTTVTLTATVQSSGTAVTPGQVAFCSASLCSDTGLLGKAQLVAGGTASIKVRLGGGAHTIYAKFLGTSANPSATSSNASLTVTPPAGGYPITSTQLLSSGGSAGNYSLQAQVRAPTFATGTVTLQNLTGNQTLGTATLGPNTFGLGSATAYTSNLPAGSTTVLKGDFNGDGIPDLAIFTIGSTAWSLLIGDGVGGFTATTQTALSGTFSAGVVGDFNNDGTADILAIGTTGSVSTAYLLANNGSGSFSSAATKTINSASALLAVADFNHDGNLDFVLAGNCSYAYYVGDGTGSFSAGTANFGGCFAAQTAIAAVDIDGDGYPELVTIYNGGTSAGFYINKNNAGAFASPTILSTPNATGSGTIVVADMNGDGFDDLVFGGNNVLNVALSDHASGFTVTSYSSQSISNSAGIAIVDYNGDGYPDAMFPSGTSMTVYGGTAGGGLNSSSYQNFALSTAGIGIVPGDFAGTGNPGVALVHSAGSVDVFLSGNLAFTNFSNIAPNGPGNQNVVAKYGGDSTYATSTSNTVVLIGGTVATTTTLNTPSPATGDIEGGSVTVTATVAPTTSGTFTLSGSVTFYDGATLLGTGTLSGGVASITTTAIPAGTTTLTAVYSGDTNFIPSTSAGVAYTVQSIPTKLVFTVTPATIAQGNSVSSVSVSEENAGGVIDSAGNDLITLTVTGPNGYTNTLTANASGGTAVFNLNAFTITYAGSYTYTATGNYNGTALTPAVVTGTVTGVPLYTVTTLIDDDAAGTSGTAANCTDQNSFGATADSACSFRDAIAAINAGSGGATINFATAVRGVMYFGASLPTITQGVTITGPGQSLLTLSGATSAAPTTPSIHLFTISSGIFNLSNLRIAYSTNNSNGGAILYNSTAGVSTLTNLYFLGNLSSATGGAISKSNTAATTISNTTFDSNVASSSLSTTGGGAIGYSTTSATLTITNSLFTGNTGGNGGAILIGSTGTVTISNSTFTGNAATFATATSRRGGAIYCGSSATFNNVTIVQNTAGIGGGVYRGSGTITLNNTIVEANTATNTSPDFFGPVINHNGLVNAITTVPNSTYPTIAALGLAPLGDYGGPTFSMPPFPNATAVVALGSTSFLGGATTDQRGVPRTLNSLVDRGAVEANFGASFVQQPTSTPTGGTITPAPTVQITESGYALPAPSVSVAISSSGSSLSGTTAATSSATGLATFNGLTLTGPAAAITLSAGYTPNGETAVSATSNPFAVYGTTTQLLFGTAPTASIPSGGNAGSAITVKESDSLNTTTTNATDTITLTVTGPNSYSQTYNVAAVAGVATFNLSAVTLTAPGSYTYTATTGSYTQAQATETVLAPFASLVLSALPAYDQTAAAQTFTVTAKDSTNSVMTTFTGTVALTSTDGAAIFSATPYTFLASDNGVHSFTVTFNTAGPQTVTATSGVVTASQNITAVSSFIWLVNADGTLVKLNDAGTVITSNVGSSGTAASAGGVAFDNTGKLWSVKATANQLLRATSSGGNATLFTGGGLNAPASVAVDGNGSVWIANGNGSVSAFKNSGTAVTPATGYTGGGLNSPSGIAIDTSGNLWLSNSGNASVTEFIGAAAPAPPLALGTQNSTLGTRP